LLGIYSEPTERIVTFPDNVVHLVDVLLSARICGEDTEQLWCSEESEDLQFFALNNLPANIVPPAKRPLQDFTHGCVGVIR
jgi:hypothetical protein